MSRMASGRGIYKQKTLLLGHSAFLERSQKIVKMLRIYSMRMDQFSSLAPVLCQSWESRYELGIVCLQEDPERYGIIEKVFPCKLKFKSVLLAPVERKTRYQGSTNITWLRSSKGYHGRFPRGGDRNYICYITGE